MELCSSKLTIGNSALVIQHEAKSIIKPSKASLAEKKKCMGGGNLLKVNTDANGELTQLKVDKYGCYRIGSPLGFTEGNLNK